MNPTIYPFGQGIKGLATSTGTASKELLGGKGANLAIMGGLGLPIPPGFTIGTDVCIAYQSMAQEQKGTLCAALAKGMVEAFAVDVAPIYFGGYMPLVSVRSGARVSMPGMMDTILNVGLTTKTLPEWSKRIGKRAALDSYRRLIQMYGSVVDGIPSDEFERILAGIKKTHKVTDDSDLPDTALSEVVLGYRAFYEELLEQPFPDTLQGQLSGCIGAVFDSWMNDRAIEYRAANNIPDSWGTAVNVQSMVFGNMNDQSATGVLFTRDPNNGAPGLFGEFLINAQGEDVVAGIRTPMPLAAMYDWNKKVHGELVYLAEQMENHFRDMQDMEFTVQDGKLYILQTRTGKRSAQAAFRIACDLMDDGVIDAAEAVKRVSAKQYLTLKRPCIAPGFKTPPTVVGLPAAGSLVSGVAVLTAADAKKCKVPCILVTHETTPDDFGGMMASVGILTATGGATSHAAVVARGMDKACVVGASTMKIGTTVKPGDLVTIDGSTGKVWVGIPVPVQEGQITAEAARILKAAQHLKGVTDDSTAKRITLPKKDFVGLLPSKGTVVLDIRALMTGDRSKLRLRELLSALEDRKGLTGILDFTEQSDDGAMCDQDRLTLQLLGGITESVKKEGPVYDADELRKAFCLVKWSKKLLDAWTINLPQEAGKAQLEGRGWRFVKTVTNAADLIESDGVLNVDAALEAKLAEVGLNLPTILGLMCAAGKSVGLVPNAVDEDQAVFDVLD